MCPLSGQSCRRLPLPRLPPSCAPSSVAYDYEEWVAEVDGQRKWVVDECGIPRE